MCNIWKQRGPELTLKEIEKLLNDPLFNSVKYCALGGGEPTLRKDLPDIARIMISKCKNLKSIGFSTNGLIPEIILEQSKSIADVCQRANISFGVTVSLDGLKEIHDKIRGISGAFQKAIKTLKGLLELQKEKKIGVGTNCVISKWNVNELFKFYKWLKNQKIKGDFATAEVRRRNLNEKADFLITKSQVPILRKFLEFLQKEYPFNYHYYALSKTLQGEKRKLTCPFITEAISVDPNGDVYYCTNSKLIGNVFQRDISSIYYDPQNLKYRKLIEKRICPDCLQDCFWSVSFYKSLNIAIPFFLFSFLKYKIFKK
jgi:MoaA/NifB/PqqE/SkfB family radical SAM enzyme